MTNIWKVEITDLKTPIPVSLTGKGDYYSSITNKGKIYFNVWNEGKIYSAQNVQDHWIIEPVQIPNIDSDIGDPFIAPGEDYLIYRGYGKQSLGRGDLFITFRKDTIWSPPINLGPSINSDAHEICPYVTSDGQLFIFSSDRLLKKYPETLRETQSKFVSSDNGKHNIYVISANFIDELATSDFL